MNNSKKKVYISIIIVIIVLFTIIGFGVFQKAYSLEYPEETANLTKEYGTYQNLPSNDVNIDTLGGTVGTSSDSQIVFTSNNSNITYTKDVIDGVLWNRVWLKVPVTSSIWGTNRTATTSASLKTQTIDSGFSLLYHDAATLSDGTKADIKLNVDEILFGLGANESNTTSSNIYIYLFTVSPSASLTAGLRPNTAMGSNSATALKTNIGIRLKVNISVLNKDGSVVDSSKYKQMLFGMRDIDIPDNNYATDVSTRDNYARRYNGTYAEGITMLSGFASPIVFAPNTSSAAKTNLLTTSSLSVGGVNKLRVKGDGYKYYDKASATGVDFDESTAYSGFVAPVNPQGFSFYTYASGTPGSDNAMGESFTGLPQVTVKATKICESGSNCGSITKEGTTAYNMNTNAIYNYTPSKGYKITSVKVDGSSIDFDENGDSYKFENLYRDPLSEATGPDHTIEVVFTAIPVTVNYVSENGRIEGIDTETILKNYTASGTTNVPNEGHTFKYWVNDKTVKINGESVLPGSHLSNEQIIQSEILENTTFTAINEINKYQIKYKTDGNGTILGPENETINYGNSPSGRNVQINPGYYHDKWICDKDVTPEGSSTINAGNKITKEQIMNIKVKEDLTFTALHIPYHYTIDYELNGGTHGDNHPTEAVFGQTVEISNPSKTIRIVGNANGTGAQVGDATVQNLPFLGWTSDTNHDTSKTGTTQEATEDWDGERTTNKYYKNLRKDDGKVTMIANFKIDKMPLPSLEKENYYCAWYKDSEGEEKIGEAGGEYTPTKQDEELTVYAKCEERKAKIKYETDENGEIKGKEEEELGYGMSPSGTEEEAKEGYHTVGWSCDKERTLKDGSKIKAYEITKYEDILNTVLKGDMTCKVIHEPNKYTVIYETDKGGKVSIPREELEYGKNPTVKYTLKDNYDFVGWTCDKDITLNDGKKIKKGSKIGQTRINIIKVEDNMTCRAKTESLIYKSVPKNSPSNPVTGDKIKPYILAAILAFLGITFTVLLIEDRKDRRKKKNN